MTDVVVSCPSSWISWTAHDTFSIPQNPLHSACIQGSLHPIRSPPRGTPSQVLTFMCLAAKIHPRGSWEKDQSFPCSPCILHQQPHLPELLLCTFSDRAWKTKGHSHSPPHYSTLSGIQPPSPGALGPQVSQAAPPPISLPCLLGISSCPYFKLDAAFELPIANSSPFPMTSHHEDHFRCPFLQVLLLSHLHQKPHTQKRKPCHSLRFQVPNPCNPSRPCSLNSPLLSLLISFQCPCQPLHSFPTSRVPVP